MLSRLESLPRWLRDIAPLIFWMALIFTLSHQPRLIDIKGEAEEKFFYKTAHFLAYGMLAWLWWRALASERQTPWSLLGIAFALTTLYGVSDEFHQTFVPGRHGKAVDVLFDASGALAMLVLIRQAKWLRF